MLTFAIVLESTLRSLGRELECFGILIKRRLKGFYSLKKPRRVTEGDRRPFLIQRGTLQTFSEGERLVKSV